MGRVRLQPPPRIKILEALGAVAGNRVKIVDQHNCEVNASEGPRAYRVFLDLENGMASSDDNGTVFRNYVGYPIIAFMMALGKLSYDEKIAAPLKSIKWRSLNEQYKSYKTVETIVKQMLSRNGVDPSDVDKFVDRVLRELDDYILFKPTT
ncbi:MAG: hypothetical protein QXY84_01335 [Candidatus Caldarchaeum sp.]